MHAWSKAGRARHLLGLGALAAAALMLACDARTAGEAPASRRRTLDTAPAPVCGGADVHSRHVAVGFACATCHPSGGQFGFTPPVTFARGTTTAGGTISFSASGTPTCAVGCHSPIGAPPHPVTWDTPGPLACTACHDVTTLPARHPQMPASATREDCALCHDLSAHTSGAVKFKGHGADWMNPGSAGFHASSADRGLSMCAGCHGADFAGGAVGVACASCHDRTAADGSVLSWKNDCTMCHGGTNDLSGAPPRAIWGQSADPIRSGAHAAHVAGGPLSAPLDCGACHVKPVDALSPDHIDLISSSATPVAKVTFSGLAVDGGLLTPTWSRASATCASTYCHGATLPGGSNTTPSWTGGPSQAACGTCHGAPPPYPHPPSADLKRCSVCHAFTVDETGALIPPAAGGKHLSGATEITGHAITWMDKTSPNFHASSANAGLDFCQACHGAALDGVGPPGTVHVACGQCHDKLVGGVPVSWQVNCTMCHGGTDSQTGAPPRTQWGKSADLLRVGAHTKHVAGSSLANPIACVTCHPVPASAFDAGHITTSPTAEVTFSGLAVKGPGSAWNRAAGTCTSYCHGTTLSGGTITTPLWTGGPNQGKCGTCHGVPPTSKKHWHVTDEFASCRDCHGFLYDEGSTVDVTTHLNGKVDVGNQILTYNSTTGSCTSRCHKTKTW